MKVIKRELLRSRATFCIPREHHKKKTLYSHVSFSVTSFRVNEESWLLRARGDGVFELVWDGLISRSGPKKPLNYLPPASSLCVRVCEKEETYARRRHQRQERSPLRGDFSPLSERERERTRIAQPQSAKRAISHERGRTEMINVTLA